MRQLSFRAVHVRFTLVFNLCESVSLLHQVKNVGGFSYRGLQETVGQHRRQPFLSFSENPEGSWDGTRRNEGKRRMRSGSIQATGVSAGDRKRL